ncbi:VOC family protein [Deinococcus sp. VB343]|uniref:VOC family protein n=1 Tax=Deinococcus sp. VB343 TaxID=3385567 RepID=UPI0039C9D344
MEEEQHSREVQEMKLSPARCPIAAVMIHVADIAEGLNWYARAFPDAVRRTFPDSPFEYLDCGGVMLELVPADAKVQSGAAGSVVYWQVEDFAAALAHLQSLGAELYRGPMQIEGGQRMGQVRDPWGNPIGLRGPLTEKLC